MADVFLKIVDMSITASWLVLAVMAVRLIFKRAPRWSLCLLWGLVALRLIFPVSIESSLSLVPNTELLPQKLISEAQQEKQAHGEILDSDGTVIFEQFLTPPEGQILDTNGAVNVEKDMTSVPTAFLAGIWLAGIAAMLVHTLVSYCLLKRKVAAAFPIGKNIRQSELVDSPFVLGIIRPVIYLPFRIDAQDMEYVIAHELAHIRRKDHWWKPLGFLLLTIHWFNPLMWVAYILLCRDIELACDEKVIKELGRDQRADYSQALLTCSVNRRMIAACPLAFGEVSVKERVRNVLNYKKPAFWVVVLAVILCAVVAVCFLTDPNPSREFSMNGSNVSDLDPEAIVERIIDIEDITNSGIHTNAMNFSLHVDSDFNWMNSQAVRYFFGADQKTYSGQLRIFPDEGEYFLTEPTEWPEQNRIFLLRHFLEAIRYLPQDEIRQMAPADQYIIQHVEAGRPGDYERVIMYASAGVGEMDSWFIHLQIQPLHAEGEGYRGTADEVIDLFYGDGDVDVDYGTLEWFDFGIPEAYDYPVGLERTHPAFDGVSFRCDGNNLTAEDESGERTLFGGMPIWNVYFTDLNGDVYPEICATVSFGSGLVDTHVVVYDYINGQEYTLWDRGHYDFSLRLEDDVLYWDQYLYADGGAMNADSRVGFGELAMVEVNGRFAIDQQYVVPDRATWIVDIEDRSVTEQLPTDEALELFYEDAHQNYFFPSIRSHLVMVTYSDGSTEDIRTALAAGRVSILDLNRFDIQYYAEEKQAAIQPSQANLRGFAAEYLFVPINGATYRYTWADSRMENVTADRLLDTFTEETEIEGIVWGVYSLKEYPDMTKLLLISGTNAKWLCEYAPAKGAGDDALQNARNAGYVIEENGKLTDGADVWQDFYEKTRRGEPASVTVAHYYTLDPQRTAPETYAACQEDYPMLFVAEISYNGEMYTLRTEESVKTYEYLMKYTVSGTPMVGDPTGRETSHYVLTHDNTHTWEQLFNSLVSSFSGAYIDHYNVCTETY